MYNYDDYEAKLPMDKASYKVLYADNPMVRKNLSDAMNALDTGRFLGL